MRPRPPPTPAGRTPSPRPARPAPANGARVWIVRHGEVSHVHAGTAYGSADVPLSPRGEHQTRTLARSFGPVAVRLVLASPLARAARLGEAIARATGAELSLRPGLAELDRGDWAGIPFDEYERRWADQGEAYWRDPSGWRGHGGESEAQLLARAWPPLEEAAEGGGTVVLATHRHVLRALVAAALGAPPGAGHALCTDPARGALLVAGEFGWTLERSNAADPGGLRAGDL